MFDDIADGTVKTLLMGLAELRAETVGELADLLSQLDGAQLDIAIGGAKVGMVTVRLAKGKT